MQFSIVITTKNRKEQVCRLVRDLLTQPRRHHEVELIVVDNASTDGTVPFLKRVFKRSIRIVTEEAKGPSACRNTGLRLATHDTVIFLDDDIRVPRSFFASFAAAWKRFPDAGIIGARIYCDIVPPVRMNTKILRTIQRFWWVFTHQDFGSKPVYLSYGSFLLSACMSVRKRVITGPSPLFCEKLGRPYIGILFFGEDYELCNRFMAQGKTVVYIPNISVRHHTPSRRLEMRYILRRHLMAGITSFLEDAFLLQYRPYRVHTKWRVFVRALRAGTRFRPDWYTLSFSVGYILFGPFFLLASLLS